MQGLATKRNVAKTKLANLYLTCLIKSFTKSLLPVKYVNFMCTMLVNLFFSTFF